MQPKTFDVNTRAGALKVGAPWSKLGRLRRLKQPQRGTWTGAKEAFVAKAASGRLLVDTYLSARELLRETT